MKHLENYILQEALKEISIDQKALEEQSIGKTIGKKISKFSDKTIKKAKDIGSAAKKAGSKALDTVKTAAIRTGQGAAVATAGYVTARVAAKGVTQAAFLARFPATSASMLGKGGVFGAAAGSATLMAAAPIVTTMMTKAGNEWGNPDLLKGVSIGNVRYFELVGREPNYSQLITMVREWSAKKGNKPSVWDEFDYKNIRAYVNNILLDKALWRSVHARHDEIQKAASGRDDGTFQTIRNFYSNLAQGEFKDAIYGRPALSDEEKESLDRLASEQTDKMKISVSKKGLVRAGKIITEEAEEIASRKDNDIDALDPWDGYSPSTSDPENFEKFLLPGLTIIYFKWLGLQLRQIAAETSANIQKLKSQAAASGAVKPDKAAIAAVAKKEAEGDNKEEAIKKVAADLGKEEKGKKTKAKTTSTSTTSASSGPASSRQESLLSDIEGMDLKKLQTLLLSLDMFDKSKDKLRTFKSGEADGKYGPETRDAIKKLQTKLNTIKDVSLTVDGLYGSLTHAAYQDNKDKISKTKQKSITPKKKLTPEQEKLFDLVALENAKKALNKVKLTSQEVKDYVESGDSRVTNTFMWSGKNSIKDLEKLKSQITKKYGAFQPGIQDRIKKAGS